MYLPTPYLHEEDILSYREVEPTQHERAEESFDLPISKLHCVQPRGVNALPYVGKIMLKD